MWETGQSRLHDNVWGYPLEVCSSSEQNTGTNQKTAVLLLRFLPASISRDGHFALIA